MDTLSITSCSTKTKYIFFQVVITIYSLILGFSRENTTALIKSPFNITDDKNKTVLFKMQDVVCCLFIECIPYEPFFKWNTVLLFESEKKQREDNERIVFISMALSFILVSGVLGICTYVLSSLHISQYGSWQNQRGKENMASKFA